MKTSIAQKVIARGVASAAMLAFCRQDLCAGTTNAAFVWPKPPDEPRIVYVRDITKPADIGDKPSGLSRLASWITGETKVRGKLDKPFGLSLDDSGNVLVTDTGDNAVCLLDLAHKKWTRWDTIGKTHFKSPVAVARRGETIFVADSVLGKVIAFDLKGKLRFEITKNLERPSGLALLRERLFVADSAKHHVAVFDMSGEFISRFGQRGNKPGEFNFPTHVSADANGKIYVTDSLNNRIQVFDMNGQFLRSFGSAGDGPGYFSRPKGVAADSFGHIYVVDAVFDNVQVFDDQSRLLLDWGESGPSPGQFWLPNAIAIGRTNEIYIADSHNHRIQVFRYVGKE